MTPPPKISRALHAYLTDWLAWVERGAPDGEPYHTFDGLCMAAYDFRDGPYRFASELQAALGGSPYPFGGKALFQRDMHGCSMHLNPARLTWVRQTIATAEITE